MVIFNVIVRKDRCFSVRVGKEEGFFLRNKRLGNE